MAQDTLFDTPNAKAKNYASQKLKDSSFDTIGQETPEEKELREELQEETVKITRNRDRVAKEQETALKNNYEAKIERLKDKDDEIEAQVASKKTSIVEAYYNKLDNKLETLENTIESKKTNYDGVSLLNPIRNAWDDTLDTAQDKVSSSRESLSNGYNKYFTRGNRVAKEQETVKTETDNSIPENVTINNYYKQKDKEKEDKVYTSRSLREEKAESIVPDKEGSSSDSNISVKTAIISVKELLLNSANLKLNNEQEQSETIGNLSNIDEQPFVKPKDNAERYKNILQKREQDKEEDEYKKQVVALLQINTKATENTYKILKKVKWDELGGEKEDGSLLGKILKALTVALVLAKVASAFGINPKNVLIGAGRFAGNTLGTLGRGTNRIGDIVKGKNNNGRGVINKARNLAGGTINLGSEALHGASNLVTPKQEYVKGMPKGGGLFSKIGKAGKFLLGKAGPVAMAGMALYDGVSNSLDDESIMQRTGKNSEDIKLHDRINEGIAGAIEGATIGLIDKDLAHSGMNFLKEYTPFGMMWKGLENKAEGKGFFEDTFVSKMFSKKEDKNIQAQPLTEGIVNTSNNTIDGNTVSMQSQSSLTGKAAELEAEMYNNNIQKGIKTVPLNLAQELPQNETTIINNNNNSQTFIPEPPRFRIQDQSTNQLSISGV